VAAHLTTALELLIQVAAVLVVMARRVAVAQVVLVL
jgi:hypothetical protein